MMTTRQLLSRKNIGLILRVYCPDESQVASRVKMTVDFIDRAMGICIDSHLVINTVHVLVWTDPQYKSDCGETAQALKNAIGERESGNVRVQEFAHGDIFCGILNYGVALQLRCGIDYSMIASAEAHDYLTESSMRMMIEAICRGAKATGVAINELRDSVMAGRLANTMCMWDNIALLSVGGFDLVAAMPANAGSGSLILDWEDGEPKTYYLAGVEEMRALARLVAIYKQCLGPIVLDDDGALYDAPNPEDDPEGYQRHLGKMATKKARQDILLGILGYGPRFLEGGVMPPA